MKKTKQDAAADVGGAKRKPAPSPKDIQPAATGANRGSPAAPVMKEFQKTRAESSGRS